MTAVIAGWLRPFAGSLALAVIPACAPASVAPPVVAPPPTPSGTLAPEIAAPPPPAAVAPVAPVALRGRLVGHDGAPMKLAHVHVGGHHVEVDPTGAFRIEGLPRGFLTVRFTGVAHEARSVGLFLDGHEQDVEVTLGTLTRDPAWLTHPVLVQHRRAEDGTTPETKRGLMTPLPSNGLLAAEVPRTSADLLYQVVGLFEGQPMEGTEADAFVYDGSGAYLSVLHPNPKRRRVQLDPRLLAPAGKPFGLRFAEPDRPAARIAALHLAATRRLADDTVDALDVVDGGFRAELVRALAAEKDPDVSAALRIAYLVPPPPRGDEAAAIAAALLDALAPDASLWGFRPEAAVDAVELAGVTPARDAYLDRMLDALHDADTAGGFLAARIRAASHAGREDELARLFPMMRSRFPGTTASRSVALLDPARKVRPGRELPDFDLVTLAAVPGGPPTRVTRASLRGKVTILDFWGTWCAPCRAEVKYLEKAYARHRAEGLTIVSIAANDRADHVRNFRRAISPMPWIHVVLERDDPADVLKRFETNTFPTAFVVDGAGRILAAGEELRGAGLERAVVSALASASRP